MDKDLKPEEVGGRPEEVSKYGKDGSVVVETHLVKEIMKRILLVSIREEGMGTTEVVVHCPTHPFDAMEKNMKKYKGKSISVLNEELNDTQTEYDKDIDEMKIDK